MIKLPKARTILAMVGLYVLLFVGCYPDNSLTVQESLIVFTQYDQEHDFGQDKFYYMPDTVSFLTNVEDPNIDQDELDRYQETILSTIETIMSERGYTRRDSTEANPDNTDLTINVAAIGILNQGAAWVPGPGWWWGYYPPGWVGPGWGWWYPPGWGGYPVYYSYTTGTVEIFMGDDEETPGIPQTVPLRWNAFIDGLLSGVASDENIELLIRQAFDQSPYIQTNR